MGALCLFSLSRSFISTLCLSTLHTPHCACSQLFPNGQSPHFASPTSSHLIQTLACNMFYQQKHLGTSVRSVILFSSVNTLFPNYGILTTISMVFIQQKISIEWVVLQLTSDTDGLEKANSKKTRIMVNFLENEVFLGNLIQPNCCYCGSIETHHTVKSSLSELIKSHFHQRSALPSFQQSVIAF